MDIVVKGRNVEVPEHYRVLVTEKLGRLGRYDKKLFQFDVELFHEPNRRQHKNCQRVEITTRVRGQAIRAEASAADFYGALDCAVGKLESRLRRMHDRRRVHYGRRSPASVGEATAGVLPEVAPIPAEFDARSPSQLVSSRVAVLEIQPADDDPYQSYHDVPRIPEQQSWDDADDYRPGRIAREKEHPAKPMTVDQALYEMELVGHDFYLFADADSGQPSVVYRRKGFDYGVIRLA
ncbi:MAG TPA: ribosome-associated translation inhibitor RaiA [Pseudonocardiaceae bacterium]|jgi:ribosomal subunit interface protein|nr:ribosome-associated translation inhibitor RaiA [Pseudonocardiaceae bacterium]